MQAARTPVARRIRAKTRLAPSPASVVVVSNTEVHLPHVRVGIYMYCTRRKPICKGLRCGGGLPPNKIFHLAYTRLKEVDCGVSECWPLVLACDPQIFSPSSICMYNDCTYFFYGSLNSCTMFLLFYIYYYFRIHQKQ